MFSEVLVPQAVWDELLAFHSKPPDFTSPRPATNPTEQPPEIALLGRGESEAIKLAGEIHADLLLTDDRKARRAAADMGVPCTGLLGLVVQARRTGRIPSAQEFIDGLEKQGGLYLSDSVKAEILKLAGESA